MKAKKQLKIKRYNLNFVVINFVIAVVIIRLNVYIRSQTVVEVSIKNGIQQIETVRKFSAIFDELMVISIIILVTSLLYSIYVLSKENRKVSKRLQVLVDQFNEVGLSKISDIDPILTEFDMQVIDAWNRSVSEIDYLNELREKYFKNMVHDLKTPIQVLAMNIQLLKLDVENENLDSMVEELKVLEKSVNNYLMIEKITFFEKVNMSKVDIDEYFEHLTIRYSKLNFDITSYNLNENKYINTDKLMFSRITENISENALKYGIGRSMEIEIYDNKIIFSNLIDPTSKVGDIFSEKRNYSIMGNGLGVDIINTYVKLLNWTIHSEQKDNYFIVILEINST